MDELPPLEHRDDPFALLGVAHDVDERELKRAYARKIKVYRPEKAPEEFALIHAAFEHVKFVRLLERSSGAMEAEPAEESGWVRVSPPPESEPPPPPEPDPTDGTALGRAVAEAIAREDHAAAKEGWNALRAAGESLEELIVDAPPAIQAWVFEHLTITWRELSQWRDTQAAFNVWMTAFARRVRGTDRLAEAVAMASEPALIADAGHDPIAAMLVLNAISCLAWRDQDTAEKILRQLRSLVNHAVVAGLHDRATLDVDQGGREYKISRRPPLPPHLFELMADWPILSPRARGELAEKLRTSLRADPVEYLDHLGGTVKRHPHLAEALAHRLLDGVPHHRRELSGLPDELRDKLGDELRAASRKAPWFLTLLVVLLGVVTAVAAASALAPGMEKEENVFYVFMFVFGAYVGAAFLLDRFFYRVKVRRLLAVAIARTGVTRAAAREWLQYNRLRALRLFRFTTWMPNDDALRLVGMIAGNVADDRELTSEDDQAPER